MKKAIVFIILGVVLGLFANCQSFKYDENTSKDLAGFAIIAYCSYNGVLLNNCGPPCNRSPQGYSDYNFLTNTTMGSHGVIGYSPDHNAIILTFRGTLIQDLGNVIRDLTINKIPFNPYCSTCWVHQGFYDHFSDIKQLAQYYFKKYKAKYPNAKIYVTGHSLGAAMATIAAPFIYEWNGNKQFDALYTFESPRVGDKTFSDWFKSKNFAVLQGRITHRYDPVVQNPTSWFPLYYYHVNQEVYYPDFNQPQLGYKLCYNAEDTTCGAQQNYIALMFGDHMNLFGWDIGQAGSQCNG